MKQILEKISVEELDVKNSNTLFVFALPAEAAEAFDDVNKVIVGIGKVNAAYELTKVVLKHRPKLIINLGSAGSNTFRKGEVVCCTKFVQRDMDVRGLGFQQYETPFSDIPVFLNYGIQLEGLQEGICGAGDNFETNHSAEVYNVVDMESYALAFVAWREQVPFLCLKYISDGADGAAADDWSVSVHDAALAFRKILFVE